MWVLNSDTFDIFLWNEGGEHYVHGKKQFLNVVLNWHTTGCDVSNYECNLLIPNCNLL